MHYNRKLHEWIIDHFIRFSVRLCFSRQSKLLHVVYFECVFRLLVYESQKSCRTTKSEKKICFKQSSCAKHALLFWHSLTLCSCISTPKTETGFLIFCVDTLMFVCAEKWIEWPKGTIKCLALLIFVSHKFFLWRFIVCCISRVKVTFDAVVKGITMQFVWVFFPDGGRSKTARPFNEWARMRKKLDTKANMRSILFFNFRFYAIWPRAHAYHLFLFLTLVFSKNWFFWKNKIEFLVCVVFFLIIATFYSFRRGKMDTSIYLILTLFSSGFHTS